MSFRRHCNPHPAHRLLSSSFLGLPYRILNLNHKRNYLGAYGYALHPKPARLDPRPRALLVGSTGVRAVPMVGVLKLGYLACFVSIQCASDFGITLVHLLSPVMKNLRCWFIIFTISDLGFGGSTACSPAIIHETVECFVTGYRTVSEIV